MGIFIPLIFIGTKESNEMKPKNRVKIGIAAILLLIVSLACGLSVKNGVLTVPVSLNKETLKTIFNNAEQLYTTRSGEQIQAQVDDIQFNEPNSIKVMGTFTSQSGQQVQGSVDIAFSVVDQEPHVEISSVNIPGIDLSSDAIDQVNASLSQMIQDEIDRSGQAGTIQSITVEGQVLKIVLAVPLKKGAQN